jgi:hypothetical protein
MSGFVVRAIDIATAVDRGLRGNLDLPLIRTLARDLGQDLDRARERGEAVCNVLGSPVSLRFRRRPRNGTRAVPG